LEKKTLTIKKPTWTEYIGENDTVDGTWSVREGNGCKDSVTYKCVCSSGSGTSSIDSSGN
jgi:hypothetical protein